MTDCSIAQHLTKCERCGVTVELRDGVGDSARTRWWEVHEVEHQPDHGFGQSLKYPNSPSVGCWASYTLHTPARCSERRAAFAHVRAAATEMGALSDRGPVDPTDSRVGRQGRFQDPKNWDY